jgi:hypothetical protein
MASEKSLANLNIEIDPDVVNAIVQRKVEEAIKESMVNKDDVLDRLVKQMLTLKVDGDGKPSEYRGSIPYIEWAAHAAMRKAAKDGLDAAFAKKQAEITAKVQAQIEKSSNKLAQALVSGLADSLKASWSSTVRIELRTDRD